MKKELLSKQIRNWTIFAIISILFFGITAFPLESELRWLSEHSGIFPSAVAQWIQKVYEGIRQTNSTFPFLSYGTDWLAYAHIIIALAYIGVLKDPVRNKWIIDWSILCCILVFPLALIAGPIRGIPFFHQMIDCAIGMIGLIPILIIRKKIRMLEAI